MKEIRVYLEGGLGNQLFQFSTGYALSKYFDAKLSINIGKLISDNAHTGYALDGFKVPEIEVNCDRALSLTDKSVIRYSGVLRLFNFYNESDYLNIRSSAELVRLIGYWQNECYFKDFKSELKKMFVPKRRGNCIEPMIFGVEKSKKISVHFRRGDYVNNNKAYDFHGVCSLSYYKSAMDYFDDLYDGDVEFFIFTNDPAWVLSVMDHFDIGNFNLVAESTPHQDIYLMSLCDGHIIANSSFSWWGAWLSSNDGVVIAPDKWYSKPPKINADPCLPTWLRLRRDEA
ncbi:MAG: alpha-1,2-fucosyltransferase [Plesiomonas shigelloides]